MMRMKMMTVFFIICSAAALFAGPSLEKQAQYFAGVYILQAQTDLCAAERTARYREIVSMTGITAARAQQLLREYREKPAEWQTLHDSIMALLAAATAPPARADTQGTEKKQAFNKRRR